MRHLALSVFLCLVGHSAAANETEEDARTDARYGRWEIVTEMEMSGVDGDSRFRNKTTECRHEEVIDKGTSSWSQDNCQSETRSRNGHSRTRLFCKEAGGHQETVTETTAEATRFKSVTTLTHVKSGGKSVSISTITGRRVGDCAN